MCSTITMVTPRSLIRRTSSIASRISAGVSPASASSSSSSRGSVASARAISSRLRAGRAERPRGRVGQMPEAGEHQHLRRLALGRRAMPVAQEGADHDVFQHGHVLERDRHLERPRHAEPRVRLRRRPGHVAAEEADRPLRRLRVAAEAVEERALAGAVRADQADDLRLADVHGGAVHRTEGAERLDDAAGLKQHGACLRVVIACHSAAIPPGWKRATKTMIAP